MEIKIENGKLVFDIYDLFSNLSEEEMEEVASHYLWHSSIYNNLVKSMKENLAAPHYNEELYILEKSFFTMPEKKEGYDYDSEYKRDRFEEDVLYTMRSAVREIIKENAHLKAEVYKHSQAESAVYNWILEKYGNDVAYNLNRVYGNVIYGKPYDYELAREMELQTDFVKLTQDWVAAMNKKFNPELQ